MKFKPTYYVISKPLQTKDWAKNNHSEVASFVKKWNDLRIRIVDQLSNTSYFGNKRGKEEHYYINIDDLKEDLDMLIRAAHEYNNNKKQYVVKGDN